MNGLENLSNYMLLMRRSGVPEILHTLSQPLQQELDVLGDVLIIVLLLLQVLKLLQHLALNHGQSVLLTSLALGRLLQEVLSKRTTV